MISFYIMGGLGNQLFQVFAALSYSLETNQEIFFPYNDQSSGFTERRVYWSSFLSSIQSFVKKLTIQMDVLREKGFEYNGGIQIKPSSGNKNILLYGYYQSYKYFQNKYKEICDIIELDNKKSIVKSKYNIDFNDSVSMHFRIGDYITIQDKHPVLRENYYINALSEIIKKTAIKTVYYFTEKKDLLSAQNIINRLKTEPQFNNLAFEYISNIDEDWEEMLLMSLCSHNIIANSTFSWWAAYFNDNYEKIVCYPSEWFGSALKHKTDDLFPSSWFKVTV